MRISVWQEEDSWGTRYCMVGNPHMRYVRQDDWGYVYVDPEGLEWTTFRFYDGLLGEMTIECDPVWLDIEEAIGCDESNLGECSGITETDEGWRSNCTHVEQKSELMRQKVESMIGSYIFERFVERA